MVRNDEVKQEFSLFADIWNTYKSLLPVKPRNDTEYWGGTVELVSEIMRKYPGPFAKDLSLAVLGDLERRCTNNENQNPGR